VGSLDTETGHIVHILSDSVVKSLILM